ncbi:MAG: hypothetical protein KDD66_01225 [Bdellovibrionales bacterium]|nr:hypothetical protein [Bdellovibrionales bacterium]
MKSFRRKPHAGRRDRSGGEPHWLGEGLHGITSLFDDVDEIGFITDEAVCKRALQFAQRYHGEKERPLAVYAPPGNFVGWQLPLLCERFDVAVVVEEPDPLLERACERFDAALFAEGLPKNLEGFVDFAIAPYRPWRSSLELSEVLSMLSSWINDDGELLVVAQAQTQGTEQLVSWRGDEQSVHIDQLHIGIYPKLELKESVTFNFDVSRKGFDDWIESFLKRHQPFFGRNVRDFLEERIRAGDFGTENMAKADCAAVLLYEAN